VKTQTTTNQHRRVAFDRSDNLSFEDAVGIDRPTVFGAQFVYQVEGDLAHGIKSSEMQLS